MQHKDFATKEEELKVMRFYQNDLNSAKLLINVTHDKVVTDFSTATKVQIAFLKPDGKRVFQDVQNVNQMQGKYYVVLSTQTLIVYGNVVAQLRLTFPDNKVIETCKFVFAVDESIMSDEAMKSTNEFPVIQKAIEAGEKLEGVDINGIIAAGAKADAALPKSGGTMTGNIVMEYETGKGDAQRVAFKKKGASSNKYDIASDGDTYIGAYDRSTGKRIWRYTTSDETLEVAVNSNMLKTTGGTINGDLVMATDKNIVFSSDDYLLKIRGQKGNSKIVGQVYKPDGTNTFIGEYRGDNNKLTINCDTNLIKDTGGKISGLLTFERLAQINQDMPTTPSARGFNYMEEGTQTRIGGLGLYRGSATDKPRLYLGWGAAPWDGANSLTVSEDSLRYKGKDIAFKDKDASPALVLTADGENPNTSALPQAHRRGNTVTVSGSLRRKAGGVGDTVTVLPVDLRPVSTQRFNLMATDGTKVFVTISSVTGNVAFDTAGKEVYMQCTYVVD